PTYKDGDEWVEAKPGDVLVCPAETSHSIANRTDETVDIIALIVYA
ncbi:MAG: cupin domain-containing protein, partial [Clostridia bacterium]|nr:cupin domain-containing protein [Clostridia bacterium]